MSPTLDSIFGIHEQALRIRAKRTEVIASNLANADTPNYKARDLDFRSVLSATSDRELTLRTTRPTHLEVPGTIAPGVELKYRNPFQPSLDGNTVETDLEQAAFAENAVRYQASLTFLNSKIRGIMTALTGGQ